MFIFNQLIDSRLLKPRNLLIYFLVPSEFESFSSGLEY